uniref:Uncharacterized protein n=1 Tax=Auxenochlorella protothecoides TaxID=3075 RepID=A0A1D2A1S6_AUXPR
MMTLKPSIHVISQASISENIRAVRWIPGRASFIGVGCTVQGVGAAQIWRMRESQIKSSHSLPVSRPLTSAAMLASSGDSHHVVLGDSQGGVEVWDLVEARPQPISVLGGTNQSAIHALDTCGGCSGEPGPPEVVSGAADGRVLVWDARQPERPVAQLCGGTSAAAWAVALGGAGTEQDRSVLAGRQDGTISLWDLRAGTLLWSGSMEGQGVCGLAFDRRGIVMNKAYAAGMGGRLATINLRPCQPDHGRALEVQQARMDSVLWGVAPLPQNREVLAVHAGDGSLSVHAYHYADSRHEVGGMEQLSHAQVAQQGIPSFDWHPQREGLWVAAAYDQQLRIGCVTGLRRL